MGVWADLSAELAISVFQEVSRSQGLSSHSGNDIRDVQARRDLLCCVQVSRQFRALVEPFLYRDVQIHDHSGDWERASAHLCFFSRTIMEKPVLGRHVRTLSVPLQSGWLDEAASQLAIVECNKTYDHTEISEFLALSGESKREDLQAIIDAIPSLGLLNGFIVKGGPSGIFIALLHLLPRLKILYIQALAHLHHVARSCSEDFVGGVPAGLKSIIELSVAHKDEEIKGGFSASEIIPFMALPSLKTFSISRFSEEPDVNGPDVTGEDDKAWHLALSKPPSITQLALHDSVVSCALINQILSLPTRLEKFEYEVGGVNVGFAPFYPWQFLPGLHSQASSLTELIIVTENRDCDEQANEILIGSLREMEALRRLRRPIRLLIHFPYEDDDQSDDEEGGNEVEDNSEEGTDAASTPQNPLDSLLPLSLTCLHLDIEGLPFGTFVSRTRLPQSFHFTRQRFTSLASLKTEGWNSRSACREKAAVTQRTLSTLHPEMDFAFTLNQLPIQIVSLNLPPAQPGPPFPEFPFQPQDP
ncbi:hypothetical protein DL93DRAFT_2099707 [Clavulina sp. PMI_390]|nr:hypothetical protein DL93DRAFT_2099707 [Clavulina sp. PMI_390]